MAAVSAPQAPSALTPPTSSHGGQNSWSYAVPSQTENPLPSKTNDISKPPLSHTNGNGLAHQTSRPDLQKRTDTFGRPGDTGLLAPARVNALNRKDSSISETGSAPDSLLDLYGTRSGINSVDYGDRKGVAGDPYDEEDPENSRWIHRDKLARIESQELQAAGIILPRTRAASKSSKRENSRDHGTNGFKAEQAAPKRQRVDTITAIEQEVEVSEWDLRLPEEVADDPNVYRDMSGGVKGVSKIPILKASPLPIPMEHLERDTPLRRKASTGLASEDEPISNPKSRGRSHSIKALENENPNRSPGKRLLSENSPTKKTTGAKKAGSTNRSTSTPLKGKARTGPTRDTASGQRPTTRSGELGPSGSVKRPEGDPPWLASMYKPDPRLPPDQQLLPTVAKRLQQEQWEKEGKFGSLYDTSFRPLSDEGFPTPILPPEEETKPEDKSLDPQWPLRAPKSPALSTGRPGTAGGASPRTESYSVMPKLSPKPTGIPQGVGPLPSPKPPVRVQEPAEDSTKGGCGCCVVM
ncbi:hypothetical protein B0J14DRAFT_173247 [Halenospora varia]|nr:hypothetical protein B0J14DRAFT_173247 [Halenospora varia]